MGNHKMNEFEVYKKWPNEEIIGTLMLQYDLTKNHEHYTQIPFRVIEWCCCNVESDHWNEANTGIQILLAGEIIFEGVRHCDFTPNDEGYMNYPNLKGLSMCVLRIHELCLQYSREYLG
jgi:hypothetical protein